jgi:hypothetical protein
MGKFVDITGQRFGRLVAISGKERDKHRNALWTCKCDCGNEVKVILESLKNGCTKSCGCLNKEKAFTNSLIHGKSKTRIYHIWRDMRERCTNPKRKQYKYYGARGIKVCEEWDGSNKFINFYRWSLENGYKEDLTIDRIDNNGNYCPENCRWVDMKTQLNNKRDNRFIYYNGQIKTLAQWSEELNISYGTLLSRLIRGQSVEKAFTTPVKISNRTLDYNGKIYTFKQIEKMYGISSNTLKHRLDIGWSVEDALNKPSKKKKRKS